VKDERGVTAPYLEKMRLTMLKLGTRFAKDEEAAVTVDFVVLTASVVAFNILLIINMLEDGFRLNAEFINDSLSEASADMQ